MRGILNVRPESDYGDWLARAQTDSRLRYDQAAPSAGGGWDWETGK
jgi:hypothetical protein